MASDKESSVKRIMSVIDKYKEGLATGGREETIPKALELLLEKHPEGGIIVETGSTRLAGDWGGGQFTVVAGDFCKENTQYHLFTVDIDHEVIETCKEVTKEFATFITYVENDSLAFLHTFNQKIDLLYLDSMDCPEYDSPESLNLLKSQVHQKFEMELAYPLLSDDPIVLLDDNDFKNGGKCLFSKIFLKEHGFKEILSGKQSLWIKEVL